jgi:DNA-binding transcriptional MerR regulator
LAGPDAQRDAKYKPAEVCRLADVQPYVLRYWESEFPLLAPNRNVSGPRNYTELDLQLIRRIKKLLYDEGYTIAGAKKRLEAELKKGVPLFDDAELSGPDPEPADPLQAEATVGEMSLGGSSITAVTPFDPDDTGAGSPAPSKARRKAKAPPPVAPPAPSPSDAIAVDALESESPAVPPTRTPPPIPPAPAPLAVVVRHEKDPRVGEAVAELKEILAILQED